MPLSQSVLKAAIKSEIIALEGTPEDDTKLDKFAEAVAKAIVTHITSSALVTGTVTSGVGAGGTVTGTVS